MRRTVILSAVRTPIGRFQGTLRDLKATELGALVIREAVNRAEISPERVDEVVMGNVVGAGLGQNPARQAALAAGIPNSVGALTINKVCGSGLKAVVLAAQAIKCGDADFIVAGGMESMSKAPYLLFNARDGYRMGHGQIIDSMIHDGLWDAYENFHMGNTGEVVAEMFNVTKQQQDEYAYNSHRKAIAAIEAGKFKKEIIPVSIPQKKGDPILFDTDECPRKDTTIEALSKLKPVFKKDGTVTAGNAPPVNDGASAVVVTSLENAERLGKKPLAEIIAYAVSGMEPKLVMIAPIKAVQKALAQAGWDKDEVDLYEFNEAFSVQQVAILKETGINPEKHNVHGGAVALGHPIGASGARILTTLLYAMDDRGVKKGIAALCLGGGNAVAMAVQRI
ncbi:MAG: acetyl-CoA C-acetyltransferase [Acidobacteriota bacterium]